MKWRTSRLGREEPVLGRWRWMLRALFALILIGAVSTVLVFRFFPKKAWSGVIMIAEPLSARYEGPCSGSEAATAPKVTVGDTWPPAVIAHAGGGISGLTYTNSREAMDRSLLLGCTAIEVDLEFTSDERLVLLHDWDWVAAQIFGDPFRGKVLTSEAFLSTPRRDRLSSMGEEALLEWLIANPQAEVVLDAKHRSVKMMARLHRQASPLVQKRLIAQAYQLDQVEQLERSGFERVVLTLYRFDGSDQELKDYLDDPPDVLAAVTMPADLAFGPLGRRVVATGIPTLTHPVNSRFLARWLKRRGIGVYSSKLCGCSAELETL